MELGSCCRQGAWAPRPPLASPRGLCYPAGGGFLCRTRTPHRRDRPGELGVHRQQRCPLRAAVKKGALFSGTPSERPSSHFPGTGAVARPVRRVGAFRRGSAGGCSPAWDSADVALPSRGCSSSGSRRLGAFSMSVRTRKKRKGCCGNSLSGSWQTLVPKAWGVGGSLEARGGPSR